MGGDCQKRNQDFMTEALLELSRLPIRRKIAL